MSESGSSGGCGCSCGGCLTALVIGTALVTTITLGGPTRAGHKLKSTWDYDNQLQIAQNIADKNSDGLTEEEWKLAYKEMGLVTVENQIPKAKIPYENLLKYNKSYGQRW